MFFFNDILQMAVKSIVLAAAFVVGATAYSPELNINFTVGPIVNESGRL